jgi:hypothetical protein
VLQSFISTKPTSLKVVISISREFQTIYPPREDEEKSRKRKGQINATQSQKPNNNDIDRFIPTSHILAKKVKAKPSSYNDFKGTKEEKLSKRICFNCNQEGHIRQNYPQKS